ncbi:28S ribosomal protein S7, mitochondrial-like [Oopsacas minuta]|uniref:28S ribosomal protein S7, mitochondrial-like n=1 Tax=Oopsacas minuta TaxID=111878 RepID=A0AAV7JB82_9METZ|nr:28S ribosomal protein S7, mitochondrial-like [Oopsacas minuta]
MSHTPTKFEAEVPESEDNDTIVDNIQHMDPKDYIDIVTIWDRIRQREPIRPKYYKFSNSRKLPGPTHSANSFFSNSYLYDPLSQKFINQLMEEGNKTKAQRFFSQALDRIRTKLIQAAYLANPDSDPPPDQINPVEYFHRALHNVMPLMEVVSVGAMSQYSVPVKIRDKRRISLAMKWLVKHAEEIGATNEKKDSKLAKVIELAYNKQGTAYNTKIQMSKQCVASRAHAAFRYFKRNKTTLSRGKRKR